MQKSLMKLLGVAVLTWSSQVSAVGLGGINVSSALGQPLKANIDLVAVSDAEKSGLTARLATPEAYKSAGLEYPIGITFKFEIDENTRSITILSNQTINSPFVTLLIELSWASGKLLRDYTFLIDPPGYTPEPAPLPVVQPIAPSVAAVSGVSSVSAVTAAPIVPAEVDSHPIADVETPIQPVSTVNAVKTVKASAETVKIQRGDTIAKVAAQNKPAEISLDRMIVALYRANSQKFVANNMNRVKTGTILRLPNQQELANVSASEAKKEIHAQAKDWNSYRQQLASSSTVSSRPDSAQQASTGKISSNVTDKTPVATAKEVLKLSSGNAPSDKVATAQDKQNAAQEDAIAKNKAAKEEQALAALATKNAQDAQHLLELKSQAGMLASSVSTADVSHEVASAVASAPISAVLVNPASAIVAAISAVKSTAPAHPVKPIAKPTQPETSWVDKALATVAPVLDEPLYLAGGAALVLGLGGLAYVLSRRQSQSKQNTDEEEANILSAAFADTDEEEETDEEAEDVGAATARFYQTQNAASYQPVVHEEVEEDPIEEARLFLSFGRDAQAEDILKDALKKTPNNYQLHLELLGIYTHRKDVNAFTAIAQQIKEADDDVLWAQAAALGRKIDPSNTLYADGNAPVVATPTFVTPEPAHSLDFDLGVSTNKTPIPKLDVPAPQIADTKLPNSIDLHVGTAEHLAMSPELLFDVSAKPKTAKSAVSDAPPSMDEMMFDVTSAHPSLVVTPAAPAAKTDQPMEFNMDFMLSGMKSAAPPVSVAPPVAQVAPADTFTIDFAIPDVPAAAAVAKAPIEAMPFTIDFAMPEATPATDHAPVMMEFSMSDVPAVTSTPPAVKLDFGGIDLAMGGIASASSNTESAASLEVDNKLDLAKIYMEMDDPASAREFLAEVLREGNPEQIGRAQTMLKSIG